MSAETDWTHEILTYPEPVLRVGVSEVHDQFKRLVLVRFQRKQYVVDQQVAVHLHQPTDELLVLTTRNA